MTTEPRVTIIIPCYNREKYIGETLKCVQKVNYPNLECVVVDNNSTDNSVKIIKKFIQNDSRFRCKKLFDILYRTVFYYCDFVYC